MPRKLLFIVNPNAGKRVSEKIIDTIRREFPQNIYYQVVIWKDKDHFEEITSLLKSEGYTDAVAVGGDGTVNHVAKTILGTNIRLGIVPIGSGNGLARSLGLSMNIEEVVRQIAAGKTATIDSGLVNNRPFFCTSGIGFDAHIGHLFAIRELFKYRAKNYTLRLNGEEIKRKAFLITVANAGQYGNDFYIAPLASMQDGLFHVVILKPFNPFHLPVMMTKILSKRAHLSTRIETYSANELTITRDGKDTIHFDGEPALEEKEVTYKMQPASLNVIVGDKFPITFN
jgi:diacylglycerol kinase (ATP)